MKLSLLGRLPVVGLLTALCLAAAVPGAAATVRGAPGADDLGSRHIGSSEVPSDPVLRELARSASPLDDTRALDRIVGRAEVVGVGEATHSSGEFFAAKHRIFEHLVEERGFTTFALEANWSTGLLVDRWVTTGEGDIERIMRDEFQESYRLWNTEEYLDLFRWMRRHNVEHPERQVRFMGNDLGYAGPNLFDTVTAYVGRHHPGLLPRFRELYRDSRPTGEVEAWMTGYLNKPLAERRRMSEEVNRALALLERQRPGTRAGAGEEHRWAVQHARAVAQVGTEFAHDFATPEGLAAAMLYRDRTMAGNTVWWQRATGHRMVLSAHNGHVAYETFTPGQYPRTQGAFLRDLLGRGYVTIGASFGQGSFNAHDTGTPGEPLRVFTVGPQAPGGAAHTLDRVAGEPYLLDLRRTGPAARAWLAEPREVRHIGTAYPWPGTTPAVRLPGAYDGLIHFPVVTAARLR